MGFFGDIFRLWRSNRRYKASQLDYKPSDLDVEAMDYFLSFDAPYNPKK